MFESIWISSPKMTVRAYVRDGIVVVTAPVTKKFVGQQYIKLVRWMSSHGAVQETRREISQEEFERAYESLRKCPECFGTGATAEIPGLYHTPITCRKCLGVKYILPPL